MRVVAAKESSTQTRPDNVTIPQLSCERAGSVLLREICPSTTSSLLTKFLGTRAKSGRDRTFLTLSGWIGPKLNCNVLVSAQATA